MKHRYEKGINDKTIIMLHGTGGNESDLLTLAMFIDPKAHKIGIRGNIVENGMNRYFKRYPDGSFDLDSLNTESEELYQEMKNLLAQYDLREDSVTILGYSNGSNIFLNIMRLYQTKFKNALLFHPSRSNTTTPFKNQEINLFITYGDQDPYVNKDDFQQLEKDLGQEGIQFTTYSHQFGHSLTQDELEHARIFYGK
ncbi:alpha/beta hydrolase [Erysipelothrix urinaevulpis]